MGLQAAVHLEHMPWALTKEEEEERRVFGLAAFYRTFRPELQNREYLLSEKIFLNMRT
jgi:hypothetical protein